MQKNAIMTFLSILATIFGILMGLGNLPQALKIFRRKSAKDISIITYATLLIGSAIWVLYGIETQNFAIIISNASGFICLLFIVIGWNIYGR